MLSPVLKQSKKSLVLDFVAMYMIRNPWNVFTSRHNVSEDKFLLLRKQYLYEFHCDIFMKGDMSE